MKANATPAAELFDPKELLACPAHPNGHCVHWWRDDETCCGCETRSTTTDEREFAVAVVQSTFRRL